jgi:hypothetical protein
MSFDDLRNMTKEDLLGRLGLTTKPSFAESLLPALGIFGAGMLLGAGIALMLAPKSGAELRGNLTDGLKALRHHNATDSSSAMGSPAPMRESSV